MKQILIRDISYEVIRDDNKCLEKAMLGDVRIDRKI